MQGALGRRALLAPTFQNLALRLLTAYAQGGMKAYLEYVRSSPRYSSSYIESTLEWRDDVVDGMEVSTFLG